MGYTFCFIHDIICLNSGNMSVKKALLWILF